MVTTCGRNSRISRTSGAGRHLDVLQGEAALGQRRQRVALGQPGVDEAEPGLLDAEDRPGGVHLGAADLGDVGPDVGPVQLRVEHAAALAAGAGHDQDVDALGDVLGHGRGALARLVVGVRVHRHETQLLCHFGTPRLLPRSTRRAARLTCRNLPRRRDCRRRPAILRRPAGRMDSAILADAADNNARRYPPVTETHATTRRARRSSRPAATAAAASPGRRRPLLVALAGRRAGRRRLAWSRCGSTSSTATRLRRPGRSRYTDITDTQVLVDFRVTVPAGGSAVCVLRARARDGAEVGREEVTVTAAARRAARRRRGTGWPPPRGRSSARCCAAARPR